MLKPFSKTVRTLRETVIGTSKPYGKQGRLLKPLGKPVRTLGETVMRPREHFWKLREDSEKQKTIRTRWETNDYQNTFKKLFY